MMTTMMAAVNPIWLLPHAPSSCTLYPCPVARPPLDLLSCGSSFQSPPPPPHTFLTPRLYLPGAGFLPFLPSFQEAMPGIHPVTLTASVIYYVPAIKELSMWLGFRQVRDLQCAAWPVM